MACFYGPSKVNCNVDVGEYKILNVMKESNKNIDKLFKSRLGRDEIPYKPEYWDKMDHLLSKYPAPNFASGATKIIGMSKIAFISSVIAVTAVISISIIISSHKSSKINTNNPKEINIVKSDSNNTSQNNLAQTNYVKPVNTAAPFKAGNNNSAQNVKVKPAETISASSITQSETTKKQEAKTIVNTENKTLPVQDKTTIKSENPVKANVDQDITKDKDVQNIGVKNPVIVDNTNPHQNDDKKITSQIINSNIGESVNNIVADIPKADTALVLKQIIPEAAQNIVIKATEKSIDTLKIIKDTASAKKTGLSLIDKIAEKSRVSILLGGSIMKGFSNTSNTPGQYLNVVAGLGYQYKYNDKWNFCLDGSYTRRNGSTLFRSSVRTSYFLYKETDSISLTTKSIDFIDFHLNAQRKFYKKHYLSGGLYFSTVINSLSERNEMTESPFYTIIKTSEEKGYMEGISIFNYGINIDYKYNLIKNGYIGLRFNQTLNDIIDNKIYSANKRDYISEFQFYIKWMLY
jgi:hypothetical protein